MLNQETALDRIFRAIADPTRRAIVDRLAQGEASLTELAKPFDMSLPAVHQHLRLLEESGVVVASIPRCCGRRRIGSPGGGPCGNGDWMRSRHIWHANPGRLDARKRGGSR